MLKRILAGLLSASWSTAAFAEVLVFECSLPNISFYITIYDDGSPARIGREQGVGDLAEAYFDKITGAWVLVEFVACGTLPSTLTTILRDGTVWHSRQTLAVDGRHGRLMASQETGTCRRRSIR